MNPPVALLNLKPEIELLGDEFDAAIRRVMDSGQFILGPEVSNFEHEVAEYLGVKHAIGCNSGTDALEIALRALDVEAGDEVITTPFSFFATAEVISKLSATPVFVDIDPETYNIDPAKIEAAITENTKAIIPVHLFGQPADMAKINAIADAHGIKVVEDCAQAFGSRIGEKKIGNFGDLAAFSFFPSKNLGAFGDGGLISSDDDELANIATMLRKHGSHDKYRNERIGYNSRLDAMQAAILRVKLPHIDQWNSNRRATADEYNERLSNIPWIKTPPTTPDGSHVVHQYTLRCVGRDRDEVCSELKAAGISNMVYYPVPIHKLPVYADQNITGLPEAELAASQVFSLPMGPFVTAEEIDRVVTTLQSLADRKRAA